MKKFYISFCFIMTLLFAAMLSVGGVAAVGVTSPVIEIQQLESDENHIVLNLNVISGEFNSIDLVFDTEGLVCEKIEQGADFNGVFFKNTSPDADGSHISAVSVDPIKEGTFAVVTLKINSGFYSFSLDAPNCAVICDSQTIELTPIFEGCFTSEDTVISPDGVLKYKLSDDGSGYCVVGCVNSDIADCRILQEVQGVPVTQISSTAFSGCNNLKSITIPSDIRYIGPSAFLNCEQLETVYFDGSQYEWSLIGYNDWNNPEPAIIFAVVHGDADHSFNSEIVIEPTCTTSGQRVYFCRCGESYTEIIYATGHSLGLYTVEPTCSAEGYECIKCSDCGVEYNRVSFEKIQHTPGEWRVIVKPGCEEYGVEVQVCAVCEAELQRREISPKGHNYVCEVVTQPTADKNGLSLYTCLNCSDSYNQVIPAVCDHNIKTVTVEPTCRSFGYEYNICLSCGNIIGDTVIIPSGDHTYSDWVVEKQPTSSETGLKSHTCTVCYEAESLALPTLHLLVGDGVTVDYDNNIISGLDVGADKIDLYVELSGEDYIWEYKNPSDILGTGSEVMIKNGDTVVRTYKILIFGDVNGDGWYDGADSVVVSCIVSGLLKKEDVSDLIYAASDCNHDGVIDSSDVVLLEQAGLLLSSIDQSKPVNELKEDGAYIEYISLVRQSSDNSDGQLPQQPSQTQESLNLFDFIISLLKKLYELISAYIK